MAPQKIKIKVLDDFAYFLWTIEVAVKSQFSDNYQRCHQNVSQKK